MVPATQAFLPVSQFCYCWHGIAHSGEKCDETEKFEGFKICDDGRDVSDQTLDIAYHSFRQKICRFVRLQ